MSASILAIHILGDATSPAIVGALSEVRHACARVCVRVCSCHVCV
jgi:hypothetical protein